MPEVSKTPKAPKTPKTKVEAQPSPELNPIITALKEVQDLAEDAVGALREVINKKLPKGTFTDKVEVAMIRKIDRVGKVAGLGVGFLGKRSLTLGRRIAQAATKEQRKAEKLTRAQDRLQKAQDRVAKLQGSKAPAKAIVKQ